MSSDRIPEHEKTLVEKVESGLRDQVVDESEIDDYDQIEDFFGSEDEAKKYLESYHDFFGEYQGALEYLEQWESSHGDVEGIRDSLTE
ncbi:MAG: hypothetical protein ABEK10_04290 [Candidatus Nanosalina sp.]